MKRLLQVSLDTLMNSFSYLIIWIILSILVDKSLINIFTLSFPIQYIGSIISSIFGTGANIKKQKGFKNDADSGLLIGTIFTIFIFSIIGLNVDTYLKLMNANVNHFYMIYAIILIGFQTILNLILTNLYYRNQNRKANKYSFVFHFLSVIASLITSITFKNPLYIIIFTSITLLIITFIMFKMTWQKSLLKFHIKEWIKLDSIELSNHILLCLAYLFGISTTFNYGEEYGLVLTFTSLITDIQWDMALSIGTVAKIDISQNALNYKEHLKNAYKLCAILAVSVLFLFSILYNYYEPNIKITLIFLSFHILDFFLYPLHKIKTYYLQLNYSTLKITNLNIGGRILRLCLNLLKTPYCVIIAQIGSGIYQIIIMDIIFKRNYVIKKNGKIERKLIND